MCVGETRVKIVSVTQRSLPPPTFVLIEPESTPAVEILRGTQVCHYDERGSPETPPPLRRLCFDLLSQFYDDSLTVILPIGQGSQCHVLDFADVRRNLELRPEQIHPHRALSRRR
jgi:hypothetical protein